MKRINICDVVTCEEHVKSLNRAKSIICSAYTLGDNPYSHIESHIIYDIESLVKSYQKIIDEYYEAEKQRKEERTLLNK